ncbi:ASCH domain-containing protein [Bradyrhizobium sp. OK095]|uniref:ASCH domain-containing protein n=1 Tax=Bradyrhizobium sp. OK095 TaxID=1882760 RepID=UPI000B86E26E|nr:ASCH domain-containing protein [Bradyrhizobium sp. OK095]
MEVQFDQLLRHVNGNQFWLTYLSDAMRPQSRIGIHLAIFSEPFLSKVLSGEKTIESRFSRNRCAPYGEIGDGDIILIKQVAGPICGIALARRTWFYDLVSEPIDRIRGRFGWGIGGDDAFWAARTDALYATLIELDLAAFVAPVSCEKRDRRGWVSLRSRQMAFDFA